MLISFTWQAPKPLSLAVKSLIWLQLDTADYIPRQIPLQAVDKIVGISSQFKNKFHLSREIKIERRTWHHQQQQLEQKLIDMEVSVSVWRQEIVSLCVVEKKQCVCIIPIEWHWRIQQAASYKIASWEGISGDRRWRRKEATSEWTWPG